MDIKDLAVLAITGLLVKKPYLIPYACYLNMGFDTIPPTANVTVSTLFTSSLNVSVNISFSEPCIGGGFGCKSVNVCNLLVYGSGQVIPSSFSILQPNLMYSLLVSLSPSVQFGRAILVMDRNFCTDIAGNNFTRMPNSSVFIHFDRRKVYVNTRIHIPEKLLQLNSETRTVQATNDYNKLKVYLYFSAPVLNSSTEIMNSLNISQGSLLPINAKSLGNRRFGFMIADISSTAIISVDFNSESIITRQGTQVSPTAPVTLLYDSKRPTVMLSTYSMRTREHNLQILIKFAKPVFGFNTSCISVSGGLLKSLHEIRWSTYIVELQADDDLVFVSVPENVTHDVAGNKNLASNVLQVRHYSVPLISSVISAFATATFALTSIVAGLLTISTASLQSVGTFMRSSSFLTVDPARNLFRIMCHIQVFALSRWLTVKLPVEFYEFARHLQWTIPYFSVPWEGGPMNLFMVGTGPFGSSNSFTKASATIPNTLLNKNLNSAAAVYGSPLTSSEYQQYFESTNMKPEAEYIWDSRHSSGWTDFSRSMFWLTVICGGLIVLHALLLMILKFVKRNSEKNRIHGALTFPRFEIFLIILALPSICKASAGLIRGGSHSAVAVGILLLVLVSFALLALFMFLSVGITFGKLLQYKEVHQEGETFHWYQELVRVTLGPGKRGQWTWKEQPKSVYLTIFGPLFEDLRGPPKYMLSQITGGSLPSQSDRIIASDDETEDAEAPFIQKLFGILRIYYVFLESIRRVSLGILAGVFVQTQSSKSPVIILLSITSFQLFFMVLKKPFIKKKVQLVEIISLTCEVALFATCLVLLKKDFSVRTETKFGIFMLVLFLVGYISQIINEWYALYVQTRLLDPEEKSFLAGLKIAAIGFLLYLIPQKCIKNLEKKLPQNGHRSEETQDITLGADRYRGSESRSSGTPDRPWLKQLRDIAKASFGRERSGAINEPSTSSTTRWSGFWGTKRSGNSSDFKSKPNALYKDLEAIFASK
ncbi:putative transmembrane protein [Sesbania bispinosa]|nr:putative transmembrane protein [Sesbania bispinosa]